MTEATPRPGGTEQDRAGEVRTGDDRINDSLDRLRAADPEDLDAQIALGAEVHDVLRDRLTEQA